MNNWDKILKDFAHKCGDGGPSMTNPNHLTLLRESLIKFGWKENATNEFIGNLREGKEIITENWWDDMSDEAQAVYIKKYGEAPDIAGGEDTSQNGEDDTNQDKSKSKSVAAKKQSKKDKFIMETIDLMRKNLSKGRRTGVAGEFDFETQEGAQAMKDFYQKKEDHRREAEHHNKENNLKEGDEGYKDPFLRQPKLYNITEEDVDKVLAELEKEGRYLAKQDKEKGQKDSKYGPSYLIKKVGSKGAPNPNAATPERTRAVLRHYLETGGISIVSEKQVPFSKSQLDHAMSLSNGGKDEPDNWYWMEARYNVIKGAREDAQVVKMTNEVIQQKPEEFKAGKLTHEIKNIQKTGFTKLFTEKFKNGDQAGLTEENLDDYTVDELQTIAKGLNDANEWGEGADSVRRYASNKDKNPNSPTFGQTLSRKFSDGKMRVIAKQPEIKIYQKLADGEELTDKEKEQVKKDRASWGVKYDPETETGSPAEFKDKVKKKDGTEVDSTTLVDWKNPKTGKTQKMPIGFVRSIAVSGETRESGGGKLSKERMIESIIEGFKRSKTTGPLMTKSESDAIDKDLKKLQDEITLKQIELEKMKLRKYEKAGKEKQVKRVKNRIDKLQKSLE
jgi:hypothetical protein